MKKILVAIDYSTPAENAARYAISLAGRINATILLGHVQDSKSANSSFGDSSRLHTLAEQLADDEMASTGRSVEISVYEESGTIRTVLKTLFQTTNADFLVMGFTGAGLLSEWIFGSESQSMMDWADFPILLVPTGARGGKPRRIVFLSCFATDELEPLQLLCTLAAKIDAELIVRHTYNNDSKIKATALEVEAVYFEQVSSKLKYDKLIFEQIYAENVRDGVRDVSDDDTVDMVAILHRQHTPVDLFFEGSLSHQISRSVQVPLFVFQPKAKIYCL